MNQKKKKNLLDEEASHDNADLLEAEAKKLGLLKTKKHHKKRKHSKPEFAPKNEETSDPVKPKKDLKPEFAPKEDNSTTNSTAADALDNFTSKTKVDLESTIRTSP